MAAAGYFLLEFIVAPALQTVSFRDEEYGSYSGLSFEHPLWDDADFAWLSDITVFEGASRLAEVGAGIGFLPNTTFICRMSDQDGGHHFEYHTSERSSYDHPISLRFEDGAVATCDVLIDADGLLSRACVVMMERMVSEAVGQADESATRSHEARAAGLSGRVTSGPCEGVVRKVAGQADVDALVAASQSVWSGFVAYRVLISAGKKLRERAPQHSLLSNPMLYFGKNACIVGYSIQNGACPNVIFFTFDSAQEHGVYPGEWMRKAAKAEFAGAFKRWEPEVQAMLDCVDGVLRWAVHTTKPPGLPTFVHGRTALGDAAHSMTPFQGSGAGQAIEDAWLLAHLLGDPSVTRDTIPEALRVYDAARRPVAQDVQERSRVNGHLLALNYRGIDFDALQGEAQRAALIELGEPMQRDWEWAWSTSTDGIVHDSLEILRKAVL
ncbi:hypothetical protein K525DRAFT_249758 [Schizophyllum commune Loenen D]|nr:hypothetical protein K525DRAFT_249758 [Schizophyllum commune Loenen D]